MISTMIALICGFLLGILTSVIIVVETCYSGTLRIDKSDSECVLYRYDLYGSETDLQKRQFILLNVDPKAKLSQ